MHAKLPAGAQPTGTSCYPLHRHVIDRAPDDVVHLTRQRMEEELGSEPHIVLVLERGDLDPQQDAELVQVLERTGGGVLVFGVCFSDGSNQ